MTPAQSINYPHASGEKATPVRGMNQQRWLRGWRVQSSLNTSEHNHMVIVVNMITIICKLGALDRYPTLM